MQNCDTGKCQRNQPFQPSYNLCRLKTLVNQDILKLCDLTPVRSMEDDHSLSLFWKYRGIQQICTLKYLFPQRKSYWLGKTGAPTQCNQSLTCKIGLLVAWVKCFSFLFLKEVLMGSRVCEANPSPTEVVDYAL